MSSITNRQEQVVNQQIDQIRYTLAMRTYREVSRKALAKLDAEIEELDRKALEYAIMAL